MNRPKKWTPESWRKKEALHQPVYPDAEVLGHAEARLGQFPPLVFAGEARNLKAKLAQVAEGGATLVGTPEDSEYGRFGWFVDPEGNKIELWQPPG